MSLKLYKKYNTRGLIIGIEKAEIKHSSHKTLFSSFKNKLPIYFGCRRLSVISNCALPMVIRIAKIRYSNNNAEFTYIYF